MSDVASRICLLCLPCLLSQISNLLSNVSDVIIKVSQRQPLYQDPRLPPGWSRALTMTTDGTCSVSILDNLGRVFRSREELRMFIIASGRPLVDPDKIDFSVFGTDL